MTAEGEVAELRRRLAEAEQTIEALLAREVDAVVTEAGTAPIMLRAAQESLRNSERRCSAVFDATGDAMVLFDDGGGVVDANKVACELLSSAREDLLGQSLDALGLSPLVQPGAEAMAEIVAGGRRRTMAYRTRQDVLPGLHLAVFRDVTASRAAQVEHARLAAIVESSNDAIIGVSRDGTITDWNSAAERLYGYGAAEALGTLPAFLELPDEQTGAAERWSRVLRGEHISGLEAVRVRKDGSRVEVSLTMSPIRDAAGNIIGGSKIARDISERRAAEQRFRAVLEAAPDAIVVVNRGRIVMMNREAQRVFGYAREELLGQSIHVLVPDELRARHEDAHEAYVRAPTPRLVHAGRDLHARRKDGSAFDAEITLTPMDHQADEVLTIASVRDVTERNKMREQLMISDRMVSIGTLAAGVAHEINNPLATVAANLELALNEVARLGQRFDDVSELEGELKDARDAADRVRQIVRDLKIFSRSEDERLHAVDVRPVMESTLRMAWNEIRHRARLVKDYGKVPLVRASNARLGQVFLNLVVNAAQAIPEGHVEDNEIRITTSLDANGQVVVAISDTGSGMPPEVVRRLFTPFFTTKPIGEGTGLGLSICQRLVTGFGGHVSVESQAGKGTVFRIFLPQAQPDEALEATPVAASSSARRGRVLVVDDEPAIGRAVQRALRHEHDVTALTSARDALERFLAGERFDVVFCDLMMPEMTGMDLHAAALEHAPEQAARFIFLSGGAFTPSARAFVDATTNLWVEKPFDLRQLRMLVADKLR